MLLGVNARSLVAAGALKNELCELLLRLLWNGCTINHLVVLADAGLHIRDLWRQISGHVVARRCLLLGSWLLNAAQH